jgi:hypothetical protein
MGKDPVVTLRLRAIIAARIEAAISEFERHQADSPPVREQSPSGDFTSSHDQAMPAGSMH